MNRYIGIESATFGATPLPLPLSVRLSRSAEPKGLASDSDAFVTSVQLSQPVLIAELRVRGTATAESLALGQQADLSFTVRPAESDGDQRKITLVGAVLTGVELTYEQSAMASAMLRFAAEAAIGGEDPFLAENVQ